MKKMIIFSAALLISTLMQAQTVGLYAGANFTGVNMTSPNLSTETKAGYQAGGYFRSGKILYGQAGLEYQMMQSHFTFTDSVDASGGDDVRMNLLKLPLYVGVNLLPLTKSMVNVRVYAGPDIAYLMKVPLNQVDFNTDDFNRIRIDGSVGAGLDILLFSVDVGYNFGMNNLFTSDYDGKTHYAFVNVGVKF